MHVCHQHVLCGGLRDHPAQHVDVLGSAFSASYLTFAVYLVGVSLHDELILQSVDFGRVNYKYKSERQHLNVLKA